MPVKNQKPVVKKKSRLSPEQRAVRTQRIFFSILAVIMILAMVLVTILVTAPVYVHRICYGKSDFPSHIQYAKLILGRLYQQVPIHILAHPAYQLLLIGAYLLAFQKAGMYAIAVSIQVAVQILTVLIIYMWFGRGKQTKNWLRAIWAVSLTLVAPIMVFVF